MGCLCSSKVGSAHKVVTRSATFCSTRDFGDVSFVNPSPFRNFQTEFKLLKGPIGSGLIGEIRLCRQFSTSKIFAVKVVSKAGLPSDFVKKKSIETQVKIMQGVDHPSILKIFDFFEDACSYYLVMEYISGGDLYSKLDKYGKFSEKTAAKILKQILSALAYLHSNDIVHRDIKLENFLIEENDGHMVVKLIDFDTTTRLKSGQKLKGISGTVYYMAPEVINGLYDEKCDVWSAGVILYSLMTQNFPFGGETDKEIMVNITSNNINLRIFEEHHATPELLNFLRCLLNPDQESRISASEASRHPWILKYLCSARVPPALKSQQKTFKNSLTQALKLWAVKNVVPSKELSDYHMMFLNIDKNFDGVISKQELIEFFGDNDNIEKVMEIADWNSNGVLEYHEFISLVIHGKTLKRHTGSILEVLDKDKSGKIILSDLVSFLEYQLEGGFGFLDYKDDQSNEITDEDIVEMITA